MCKAEGSLLCFACTKASVPAVPSCCYRCHSITRQSAVCKSCRSSVNIRHVWVATSYEGLPKDLLRRLKFDRARSGAKPVAAIIDTILPQLPDDIAVCYIPTANDRIRKRGYDQAEEISKELCRLRGWRNSSMFLRIGSARQVGATRRERFKHLEKALKLRRKVDISGKHVLLIDDVTTTGATIEAAAKILKDGGAKIVDVAVFAQP